MGLFGLSNNAVSFLGGVAEGVEKQIEKDQAYTNDLVRDSASMVIKARLDSKERRRERVGEYSKEMSQLVAIGYGKQESAGIVSQGLTNDYLKLAKTTPRDKLSTLYKVTSKYQGETPLSIADLSEAIAGKYQQPTIDLSGIPKRGTFLSAIGLEGDPSQKIKERVQSLSPDDKASEIDFDALAGALSGEATSIAQEKLRSKTGEISNTYASGEFTNALNMIAGGKAFIDSSGRQRFSLDKNEDAQTAMLQSSQFLSEFSRRVDEGEDRQKVFNDIINRILGKKAINYKPKNNIKIDPKNIIDKKDGDKKKPDKKITPKNDVKIDEIKKNYEKQYKSNNFNTLGDAGKAKFRRDLIKQLVQEGGMLRQDAIDYAKATYP
tara:strand:+ start:1204 stop:2340 length:1137 start_codon:yes stop_codon:yes gene_type:complete